MKRIIVAACIALSACATTSGIVDAGDGVFYASKQAASSFSGAGSLKAELIREASEFCSKSKQAVQITQTEESTPPYVFGNYPHVEIYFRCGKRSEPHIS